MSHKVRDIMMQFAENTGLSSPGLSSAGKPPRRYLWTDAFAVCNFLELYQQTGDEQYRRLALSVVDQVHAILGRHRADDTRTGWISGLDEQEGNLHPTIGGLRIGKKLNERKSFEPFDEEMEWDRDGQYYHYLTKWMHALNRVSRVTTDATFNRWAMELAKTAHARFTYAPLRGRDKRMYWKMSIDLSYPLVPSMGHHDPLDGLITYSQLQAAADNNGGKSAWSDLSAEIAEMAGMCEGQSWATDDPLGMGDLLCNSFKVAQLIVSGDFGRPVLLEILLDAVLLGLETYGSRKGLRLTADYRLAFRELGLSLGLHAAERLKTLILRHPDLFKKNGPLPARVKNLMHYTPMAETIETFWLDSENREFGTWTSHQDINMVMLATSIAPDAYLLL